jgi:GT2 family glycosyltransferase
MKSAALVTVSVVVPSKNRPAEIARMLRSLRVQPTLPLEVIVVDQSTPAYDLEPFPALVHLHDPALSGLTAARNRGVDRARGDVVLFFDDDVLLESDCVAAIAALFAARPDVVGAQCTIHNPWDDLPPSLHELSKRIFEHGFFDSRPMRRGDDQVPRLIDGLASAYRRTLFAHERFDEAGLAGYCLAEDWDFTKRASRHGNLIVVPAARVRHVHSPANRPDVWRYIELRWKNILYLYDKLETGRDIRNRFWKQWWMLGERLRAIKLALQLRSLL